MSWYIWLGLGYVGGRFGEAIVKWGWAQAKAHGWVKS